MHRVKQRYIRQVKMIVAMLDMQLTHSKTTEETDFPRNFSRVPGVPVTVEATPEFFLKMAVRAVGDYLIALSGGNPYDGREGSITVGVDTVIVGPSPAKMREEDKLAQKQMDAYRHGEYVQPDSGVCSVLDQSKDIQDLLIGNTGPNGGDVGCQPARGRCPHPQCLLLSGHSGKHIIGLSFKSPHPLTDQSDDDPRDFDLMHKDKEI